MEKIYSISDVAQALTFVNFTREMFIEIKSASCTTKPNFSYNYNVRGTAQQIQTLNALVKVMDFVEKNKELY